MSIKVEDKYEDCSDGELVSIFRQERDVNVLACLYKRYMDLTYGLCLKYLKNPADAKDAVMDIFEILLKRLPNHEVANFKPWLYRLSCNHCLDKLRKKSRGRSKKESANFVYTNQVFRPNDDAQNKELDLSHLENCLEQITKDQKKCIELFYLKKKSYKEVSEELNISWGETRSFIQNGKRNLKQCIELNKKG